MKRNHPWVLLGSLVLSGNALADVSDEKSHAGSAKPTANAIAGDDSALVLGATVVQGGRTGKLATKNVLTSVDVLGADRIEDQSVRNVWQLFGQMPGVLVTDFNQGTSSGKFSFRAFNGEGEINAVKLLIDGVPSNSNDGNMPFLDAVFPLEIASITTVRGTNDPRYGLNNIAGNASVNTLFGGNYARGRVGYGSFGTYDTEAVAGIDNGTFSQNYAFGYRNSQGYRDHSQADKAAFSGKWFYSPEDGHFQVGLIARYSSSNANEPGYLTQADAHTHPTQSYGFNQTDEGKRETGQYSLHLDAELTPELSWSNKAYLNTFRDRRWVTFSAGVSQQERFTDEQQVGASSVLTYRPKINWLRDFALEGGVDAEHQMNESLRYNTVNQVRVKQTRDQDFNFDVYGAYLQSIIKPTDALKLVPGYRIDVIRGSFTNGLTGQPAAINDYGVIGQPKFSAVYTVAPGYNLYGNWGRTFQAGVGAGAYKIPPRTTDLAPSINDGWELGLRFNPRSWLEGRVAYWEQLASHEVRRKLNDPLGDSDNLGKTKRRGVDVQANVRPDSRVNVWLAYSYQMARITDPGPVDIATQGNQIDHIPNHMASGGIDYQATPDLRLSVWANAQSNYYLEKTNSTGKFGAYTLLNLGLNYRISKSLTADVQLKNLTNRYYEYVWYDGTQTLHSPGPGRSFFASLTLSY